MAGKFTNLKYDQQAYNEALDRSTNPLGYRLDPNYSTNCNKCFAEYGPRSGNQSAESVGHLIDVDSILKGINKINTKSNKQQQPYPLDDYQTYMPKDCPEGLESEYTRYTNPSYDLRGLNTKDLRLSYPLHDPQCNIFEDFSVNTRLQSKDNHKATWQVPINQRDLLPTENLGRVKNCTVSLNCNYAPYNSS